MLAHRHGRAEAASESEHGVGASEGWRVGASVGLDVGLRVGCGVGLGVAKEGGVQFAPTQPPCTPKYESASEHPLLT